MKTITGTLLRAALCAALALTAFAAQPPQLTVKFDRTSITASGLTPGKEAFFVAESQDPNEYTWLTFAHRERFVTVDSSGSASVDIGTDISPTSVWAVIDVASGLYTVTTPPGGPAPRSLVVKGNLLRKSAGGDTTGFDLPFDFASIIVVRPGVGVWGGQAAEGGAIDEKGHGRGKVLTSVSLLTPIRDRLQPLTALQGGDVVVIIQPQTLVFYDTQVKGK